MRWKRARDRAAGLVALLSTTTIATGESLEVRVLEGRKPLAEVSVVALPLAEDGSPQLGGATAAGTTASDGRLSLTGLDRGPYRLQATTRDGRRAEHDVGFPATGPLRGVIAIHPFGRPTAMDLRLPPAAPFSAAVPVTVRATDEHGQPAADGAQISLSTDLGVLLSGQQKAASITVTTRAGEAAAKLQAGRPGVAKVTAKYGDSEVDATVGLHGALAYLLLELGPREPVNAYGTTPPGADLPILATACDAGGHPIPGVPLQVWIQPLPGGRTVNGRTVTAADGRVQVTGLTSPDHPSYRVTIAHDRLTAVREYLVSEPAQPWIEASAAWRGVLGELTMRLHADEVSGELLTLVTEPPGRVIAVDDAGDDAMMPMVDDEGRVTVTLLRLEPGPVDLTIEADGVYASYLPLGGALVLPEPGPLATDMPLPEPAYRAVDEPNAATEPRVPAGRLITDVPLRLQLAPGLIAGMPSELDHQYQLAGVARYLAAATGRGAAGTGQAHPLANPPGLAIAAWSTDDDRSSFVVRRHNLVLGQTIEDSYRTTLLPMKPGFLKVWDISSDGRRVLVSTRPWLGNGGLTPLWVMDRFGAVDLVAADWRRIDQAAFGDQVVYASGERAGGGGEVRYEPVSEAMHGA